MNSEEAARTTFLKYCTHDQMPAHVWESIELNENNYNDDEDDDFFVGRYNDDDDDDFQALQIHFERNLAHQNDR